MEEKTKVISMRKAFAIDIAKFAVLLAAAIFAPFIRQQAITGTIVNSILFISAAFLGIRGAVLIALVPSIISLSTGLLPPVLAPMIPFIMIGNIILIMVFDLLRRKNYWLGVASASILKFAFLASVSSLVVDLLLKKEVAATVVQMMKWPQLLTALAGGIVAYAFVRGFKKT